MTKLMWLKCKPNYIKHVTTNPYSNMVVKQKIISTKHMIYVAKGSAYLKERWMVLCTCLALNPYVW